MLIDVVGIQHKQGTVEGRPYEFFEVHSLVPDAQVEGQAVDVIKLKPDVLSDVLAEVGGLPKNLVGKRFSTLCTGFSTGRKRSFTPEQKGEYNLHNVKM